MAIDFKCRCGKRIQAADDDGGTPMRCPKCHHRLTVPFPAGTVEEIIPLAGEEPEVASSVSNTAYEPPPNQLVKLVVICSVVAITAAVAGFGLSWLLSGDDDAISDPADGSQPNAERTQVQQPTDGGNSDASGNPLGPEDVANQDGTFVGDGSPQSGDDNPPPDEFPQADAAQEAYPGEYADYAQLANLLSLDRPVKDAAANSAEGGTYFTIWKDASALSQLQSLTASRNATIAQIAAKALPEFREFRRQYVAQINQKSSSNTSTAQGANKDLTKDEFLKQQAILFEEYQRSFWGDLHGVTNRLFPQAKSDLVPLDLTIAREVHVANRTGRSLTDCTLLLVIEGFYGTKLRNTYFVESWESDTPFGAGLHAGVDYDLSKAVRIRAKVWSREGSFEETVTEFPEQLRTIADEKIAGVRELMKSEEFQAARNRANFVLEAVAHDEQTATKVRELLAEIETILERVFELRAQISQLAAQLPPAFTFNGAWQLGQFDGEITLEVEKCLADGSTISLVMFEKRTPNIKKRLTGRIRLSYTRDCLELLLKADAASGVRGTPRSVPHSRNLLLQGDDRGYRFQWRDDQFLLEDASGFTLMFSPDTPIDVTKPVEPYLIEEGAVYEGTNWADDEFPMTITVTRVSGNEFTANVDYPTLNAQSRITGTVEGNKLTYTETATRNNSALKSGASYSATLDGPSWEAVWSNQGRTGGATATRVVTNGGS